MGQSEEGRYAEVTPEQWEHLWAAVTSARSPASPERREQDASHPPPEELGEFAVLLRRRGLDAAVRAFPAVAEHLGLRAPPTTHSRQRERFSEEAAAAIEWGAEISAMYLDLTESLRARCAVCADDLEALLALAEEEVESAALQTPARAFDSERPQRPRFSFPRVSLEGIAAGVALAAAALLLATAVAVIAIGNSRPLQVAIPSTPTPDARATSAMPAPTRPLASPGRVALGPIDLDRYCREKGFQGVGDIGLGTVYTWKCVDASGLRRDMDLNEACRMQYGARAEADFRDVNDKSSWYCAAS